MPERLHQDPRGYGMPHTRRRTLPVIVALLVGLSGCGGGPTTTASSSPAMSPANEVQIELSADRLELAAGGCAHLSWKVAGGFGAELDGQPVERSGGRDVCPSATTTYTLAVDAGTRLERREVTISVAGSSRPSSTPSSTGPAGTGTPVTTRRDLAYASLSTGGETRSLLLDLHLPAGDSSGPRPVLVYIHGGGWVEGSKTTCPADTFAKLGYAVACVDYRLASMEAQCTADNTFPSQIADVKTAVRWLRMNATAYGLDPSRFVAIGDSSGGHLASLLGVSHGVSALEDAEYADTSDEVAGVVDWYGPVDVTQEPPRLAFPDDPCSLGFAELSARYGGESVPYFYWTFAWGAFLGGSAADSAIQARARQATPLAYIDREDPPFLILHGTADSMVPIGQSELLTTALTAAGVPVTFERIEGGGHGYGDPGAPAGSVSQDYLQPTLEFLDRVIGQP